jgi:glycosyltransferase involved in cell wall biosynthesis
MKIGISTSVIQRGKTGIAQYIFSLLRAFSNSDFDLRFSVFTLEEDHAFFEGLDHRFEIVSVPESFRPPVRNILWHQTRLPRLCTGLDIIHIPSYRRLLWSSPCPRVATIHDLAPFRVPKKYDFARMLYGRLVVRNLARRQERIITVSANTAKDIEQFFGIGRDRVTVIHNGLDHDQFYPRAADGRSFGLDRPFLLYVARLEHPGKNHVRLIEAFERFKQKTKSNWLLAFGGSDWYAAEAIHQRIAVSPCRDEIRRLGFVAANTLPLLYSSAEAFVYPSLYEGFGLPPLEAMACGCPVICSANGSLGEVVGDAAVIIDPENVDDIAAALERLPAMRRELIENGLARAREFSWTRAAEETFSVYQRACSRAVQSETQASALVAR